MRRTALLLTLAAAYLAGCDGAEDRTAELPRSVGADGVKMELPPGWHGASENLTPKLVNPREVLSVGTLRMRPTVRGSCTQLPTEAYAEMGPADGLITIQERGQGRGSLRGYPARPAHFQVRAQRGAHGCAPPSLNFQQFIFSDAGRRFYAYVALGKRGPEDEAESILDSFHARPTAATPTSFSRCDDPHGGGYDIWVYGIGCSEVTRRLLLSMPVRSFGTKDPGSLSHDERQVVGTRNRDGWQCLSLLEADFGPIHHICRRGSQMLSFYVG
jgi:hypothetical protein